MATKNRQVNLQYSNEEVCTLLHDLDVACKQHVDQLEGIGNDHLVQEFHSRAVSKKLFSVLSAYDQDRYKEELVGMVFHVPLRKIPVHLSHVTEAGVVIVRWRLKLNR